MHPFIPLAIPFFILAAVLLIAMGAVKLLGYRVGRRGPQASVTYKLERIPGQTLLKRLDGLDEIISIQAAGFLAVPIAIYAGYVSTLYFGNRSFDVAEAVAAAAVALGFSGYALFRLRRLVRERRRVRLGYEGEMIVGQALNRLMLNGYRVYHDFPADGFNVDHVVVGENGIFAVETKTRSRRPRADRREDATVAYDGRALHFPDGTDGDIVARAKRHSKWLAAWLSQAAGEQVTVRVIVALPGWIVRRTSSEGPPVVNPKQFDSLFQHIPPRPLTPETMARIAHTLDQQCRDVEPEG